MFSCFPDNFSELKIRLQVNGHPVVLILLCFLSFWSIVISKVPESHFGWFHARKFSDKIIFSTEWYLDVLEQKQDLNMTLQDPYCSSFYNWSGYILCKYVHIIIIIIILRTLKNTAGKINSRNTSLFSDTSDTNTLFMF